jgi:glycosyltransferase involved in cell wall biosynthesis
VKIDLLFITYNRLPYVKLTLPTLLKDPTEEFSLTIWDNGSTDGTREYLSSVDDPRIVRKIFPDENAYLHGAVNDLVSKSSADLIGMVFDDILVTPGWTRPLARAHADVPEFGMIGSWHFPSEDFDYELAKWKIQEFGQHRVIRNVWTGVAAGLIKVKTMRECGPLESSRTTYYWKQMALRGYINGYYYPLILADHLDDPRAAHSRIKTEDDFQREPPTTAICNGYNSMDEWIRSLRRDATDIQTASIDPRKYVGWRAKLRNLHRRLIRISQPFRISKGCRWWNRTGK